MSNRKFYSLKIEVEFLSDQPFDDYDDLRALVEAAEDGPIVGDVKSWILDEVTPQAMVQLLYDARSEPGFFGLDDDGNDLQEEEE